MQYFIQEIENKTKYVMEVSERSTVALGYPYIKDSPE